MRKEMQQYLCAACIEDLLLICRGVGTMLPATAVLVYCLHLRAAADLSSG
jgi:hypothetical protein